MHVSIFRPYLCTIQPCRKSFKILQVLSELRIHVCVITRQSPGFITCSKVRRAWFINSYVSDVEMERVVEKDWFHISELELRTRRRVKIPVFSLGLYQRALCPLGLKRALCGLV